MNTREILQQYPFYQELSNEIKTKINDFSTKGTLNAGDRYFSEGEKCNAITFIGTGEYRTVIYLQ